MTFPDSQFQRADVEILQENTVYKGFFRMQKDLFFFRYCTEQRSERSFFT